MHSKVSRKFIKKFYVRKMSRMSDQNFSQSDPGLVTYRKFTKRKFETDKVQFRSYQEQLVNSLTANDEFIETDD